MKISIKNFRCFLEVSDIAVRPINILVGENSAGKSSFLSATRFLLELFQRNTKASFNKAPFFLGSYDQIAHTRSGRLGRAQSFSFTIRDQIDLESPLRSTFLRNRKLTDKLPKNFELEVTFEEFRSQPSISMVSFKAGDYGFHCSFKEQKMNLEIQTPNIRVPVPQNILAIIDPLVYDLSYIDLILRDALFVERAKNREFNPEIEVLFNLYRSVAYAAPKEVYASAPVRSKPERTYNPAEETPTPDGGHTPYALAQLKNMDKARWDALALTLKNFGEASGLFRDLTIKQLSKSPSGPFQVIVNLNGAKCNLMDSGYGVSQVLPILTDLLRAERKTMFLFQQPEVHLHPKAQAELATFFAQIVYQRKHQLFLETHSDYLIDRLRMEVRSGRFVKPSDVSILFFEKAGLDTKIHVMSIDRKGNLLDSPPNYREFFIREEMKLIGLE